MCEERPDYVHCIQTPRQDPESLRRPKSWCGRDIGMEARFMGLDHAAGNNLNEAWHLCCKACVDLAVQALRSQTWPESETETCPEGLCNGSGFIPVDPNDHPSGGVNPCPCKTVERS